MYVPPSYKLKDDLPLIQHIRRRVYKWQLDPAIWLVQKHFNNTVASIERYMFTLVR